MARIDFVTGNAQMYLPEVEALATVPDRVEDLVGPRPDADLRRADEGGRSGARVVGDMIARARADQHALHRMAWMSDPVIPPLDLDAAANQSFWGSRSTRELLEWLTEPIAETVELLKDQPDAAWGRPGLFVEGRRSIRQRARESAAFYDERIAELETLLAVRV
ncbi:MAG: hypothetical protein R3C39_03490, partial [Dehalococcoidia bacterium]